MPQRDEVIAAGAVVTRRGPQGREVLLVHRPKYDDWSFPKGKQDPGEHVATTAVREVLEETGIRIRLGRPMLRQEYAISGNRTKTVHYWAGWVVGDPLVDGDVARFAPNAEVDQVRWVRLDEAGGSLSYTDDADLLEQFQTIRKPTATVIVLRHAASVPRQGWAAEDQLRPLLPAGQVQSAGLAPLLAAYGVTRAVTSPSLRCVQTLAPFVDADSPQVQQYAGLSEEDTTRESVDTLAERLLAGREATVVCTHRPVLPSLLERLGVAEEPLGAAEMVVCHHRRGRIVATERHLPR